MSLNVTILGCGTSGGTPRLGDRWGACDPDNPKNRRLRCSLLVERKGDNGVTKVLVDSSPDMRQQLLDAHVACLDGVLYTHDHADHVHGIDDLRMAAYNGGRLVDVYYDALTGRVLNDRFSYCFKAGPKGEYPAILKGHEISPGQTVKITGAGGTVEALPFSQVHGSGFSLGFRFGGLAYSPDVSDLPEESVELLQDLEVWIVDALRYTTHPSHFSLEESLAWIARLKPKRAILTHMHIDLDYETLCRELPPNVEPAFDGMVLTVK
jgi:phosphoribosyl 1,2-cyclic phosphate phosphodiesterase